MLRAIDDFFDNQEEPAKSCLQALREIILSYDPNITEAWKYRLPAFCYHGKMFCYIWKDKKTRHPYIGVMHGKDIEHAGLISGNRTYVKILPIDPEQDIPIEMIDEVFKLVLAFYR